MLALLGGATIIVVSRLRVKLKVSQRGLGSHRPHGRVITECNGTRAESRFGLPAKRTSPLMLLVVFMLDSDYSPSSVRFAGRPNLLSARVPLHFVFTLHVSATLPGHLQAVREEVFHTEYNYTTIILQLHYVPWHVM